MLRTKLFIALTVLSLVLYFGIALAQENETTTAATTTNEEITAQDLGISAPTILPGSPFYFLKEWVRTVQSTLTFDALAKAKLKEKFANEKLIELQKLVEQNKSNQMIDKGISNYQQAVEQVQKVAENIKENAEQNTEVGKFLDKFVQQQALQQKILEKLQTQVPTTTFQKIEAAREQHLEKFSEVMNKLEVNKQKIQERLEQNLEKISTSTLQKIGTSTQEKIIQIRDRVLEKIQQKNTTGTATSACMTVWDPICGTDNKTYSNECFAELAGVEVSHEGTCEVKQCQTDADCLRVVCPSNTTSAVTSVCATLQDKCVESRCKSISATSTSSESESNQ